MSKISIIVPVYNAGNYISTCIDSILNQTYSNFELILINDGSKDDSLSILKEYEKKDDRVKVIDQKNMGVAKTRNKGIQISNGEYIAFIDNDDEIEEDYLERFMKEIDDFVVFVGGYKRTTKDKILFEKKMNSSSWTKFENMAPWGKIIKKDFLIKNKIQFFSFPIGEDIIFNLSLYSKTNKIKVIKNYGYHWFFNDDSVSNTRQKEFNDNIILLFDEMKKYDTNEETNYFVARYFIWYLLFSGKEASKDRFMIEYKKIKIWLIQNNYNKVLSIYKIWKNESSFKNKMIISVFLMIHKIHLMPIFSKIYCRGEK